MTELTKEYRDVLRVVANKGVSGNDAVALLDSLDAKDARLAEKDGEIARLRVSHREQQDAVLKERDETRRGLAEAKAEIENLKPPVDQYVATASKIAHDNIQRRGDAERERDCAKLWAGRWKTWAKWSCGRIIFLTMKRDEAEALIARFKLTDMMTVHERLEKLEAEFAEKDATIARLRLDSLLKERDEPRDEHSKLNSRFTNLQVRESKWEDDRKKLQRGLVPT